MDVYKVEYYEFWNTDDSGDLNSKTVSAEDAEQAIRKARKLALVDSEWVDEDVTPPEVHKLEYIEIHQVLFLQSLDG